ncbi:SpoIIE family protein phosphatase [Streptomyces sp. G44]|uniref:GAF domain-containing SpoIIE family protein phosphatase n=1 Tax=Streptomyces sp. G44 TaxID=2807632 RepID=UPI00195FD1EC|nr:GAF domain-containing SpoIIE family protein phosphatase [Streptomyces sp. G44]MBM7170137.1 SpoIIE family protein phosphatase [Streptomyces sp. G44]
MVEHLPDAVTLSTAVRDPGGQAVDMRLQYMNAAARAGQPDPDAAIGRLCSQLWPQMVDNGSFDACMRVLNSGEVEHGAFAWTEESTYRPADYEYQAVRTGPDHLLWVLRDNSARVLRAELLAAVTTGLAAASTTEEVLQILTASIMPAVGATVGAAVLNEPDSDTYVVRHIHDAQEGPRPPVPFSVTAPYPMAHTARTGRALFFTTPSQRSRAFPEAAHFFTDRYQSTAVLPLRTGDRLLGAVSFHFSVQHTFDPAERAFLTALVDHCALAMERARLRAAADGAHSQLEVLSELGRLLSSSLDPRTTFDNIVDAVVPRIADGCLIHLTGRDGQPVLATLRHHDPDQERALGGLLRDFPPRLDAEGGIGAVIRTGHHELITNVPGTLDRLARSDEHRAALHRLVPASSWLAVPMSHSGTVIGSMVLTQAADTSALFTERDIPFAQELAQRATQAVVNARRYTEQSHVAHTLQRSLLPKRLPELPGIDLAACYHPGAEGTLVGGDFYDMTPLTDTAWSLAIGDVCGKGPHAAALTGLVRHTARAAARTDADPLSVLRAVNTAILADQDSPSFCTAAYAHLDLGARSPRLTLVLGGHPRPLLRRADGTITALGRPGTLLGVLDEPRLHATMHSLRAGDTLVLYTDGVTERRSEEAMLGEEGMRHVLERTHGLPVTDLVSALERAVIDYTSAPLDDDVAIVALHLRQASQGTPLSP